MLLPCQFGQVECVVAVLGPLLVGLATGEVCGGAVGTAAQGGVVRRPRRGWRGRRRGEGLRAARGTVAELVGGAASDARGGVLGPPPQHLRLDVLDDALEPAQGTLRDKKKKERKLVISLKNLVIYLLALEKSPYK